MEKSNEYLTVDVNWQDKDEAIKVVMNFERHGKCALEDIHSYNRDGMRVTSFYLKDCGIETLAEIERAMREEDIRAV